MSETAKDRIKRKKKERAKQLSEEQPLVSEESSLLEESELDSDPNSEGSKPTEVLEIYPLPNPKPK